MRYSTLAMQTLLAAVENDCKVRELKKYRSSALLYLDSINYLVNPSATMTEDQAGVLSDYIVRKHIPTQTGYPTLQEQLPLATYINSCTA